MSWTSKLVKKTKTPRKTQKNSNQLKNKIIINMKISAKGDPVLTFSLPGGACRPLAPRQLRHCLVWDCAVDVW